MKTIVENLIKNRTQCTIPMTNPFQVGSRDMVHGRRLVSFFLECCETQEQMDLLASRTHVDYPWADQDVMKKKKIDELGYMIMRKAKKFVDSEVGRNTKDRLGPSGNLHHVSGGSLASRLGDNLDIINI